MQMWAVKFWSGVLTIYEVRIANDEWRRPFEIAREKERCHELEKNRLSFPPESK